MLYVGLHVHQRSSMLCVLDGQGNERQRRSVTGHPRRVVERPRSLGEPFEFCDEASCGDGWLHDQLKPMAARTGVPVHG